MGHRGARGLRGPSEDPTLGHSPQVEDGIELFLGEQTTVQHHVTHATTSGQRLLGHQRPIVVADVWVERGHHDDISLDQL